MTDDLLIQTADKAFAATCTHERVQAAEAEGWAGEVWDAAASIGLPWISVPESAGGAGGSVSDAVAVLVVAGRHAAPIPLAETGLLAGWLLATGGLAIGEKPNTVVPGRPEDDLRLEHDRLTGTAHRVPWARSVDRIVALVDGQVVAVPSGAATIDRATNLAGEPRDTVTFPGVVVDEIAPAPRGVDADALRFRGALSRVGLMAGALMAMAERTVAYANERRQFGRPVAGFQAVQAHLVRCSEEAALVDLVARVSAREADRGEARFEIAAAKLLADEAARAATRAAHQAHGAMGMTQEYPLHLLSRRLWSWRAEYGDSAWPRRLGRAAVAAGPDALYRAIAEGSGSGIAV
ncbi:MAG TPA: acyl-CoA dehydrogenase [Acidimicrobiales bacterium]|nr:acyl-CoA dehydrogenase [Acidimicrobiales bacterium]